MKDKDLRSFLVEGGYRLDTSEGLDRTVAALTQYNQASVLEGRIRDFETMQNCHQTWTPEACAEWLKETLKELEAEMAALKKGQE